MSDENSAAVLRAWQDAEYILPLDDVVRREVWDGNIPVRLELAKEDISTYDHPLPFFLQVPRMGYLPLFLGPARAYFQKHAPPMSADREAWVEYQGTPLRWHVPFGVLFDLLADEQELPWRLTLHLSGFPDKKLLPYAGEATARGHFFQTLKQSMHLRYGSSKRVNNLTVAQMDQLWAAVRESSFDRYAEASVALLKPLLSGPKGLEESRRVPVRVHLPHLPSAIQLPFAPYKADGELLTLRQLLVQLLPTWPRVFGPAAGSGAAPGAAAAAAAGRGGGDGAEPVVLVQGVQPPLETPVLWLCQQLAYPDSFVHVCLRPAPASAPPPRPPSPPAS